MRTSKKQHTKEYGQTKNWNHHESVKEIKNEFPETAEFI